jgi:hypothetical protein
LHRLCQIEAKAHAHIAVGIQELLACRQGQAQVAALRPADARLGGSGSLPKENTLMQACIATLSPVPTQPRTGRPTRLDALCGKAKQEGEACDVDLAHSDVAKVASLALLLVRPLHAWAYGPKKKTVRNGDACHKPARHDKHRHREKQR